MKRYRELLQKVLNSVPFTHCHESLKKEIEYELENPKPSTPSSRWRENGEQDPHGNSYDCERTDLTLGKLTDDELANAAFLNYDNFPPLQDIIDGKAFSPIVYMTAVKERIRWLSRNNEELITERDTLAEDFNSVKNEVLYLKKERDEFKAKIDGGTRIRAYRNAYDSLKLDNFEINEHSNATLILDE